MKKFYWYKFTEISDWFVTTGQINPSEITQKLKKMPLGLKNLCDGGSNSM